MVATVPAPCIQEDDVALLAQVNWTFTDYRGGTVLGTSTISYDVVQGVRINRDPFGSMQSQMNAAMFGTTAASYYKRGIFMPEMLPGGPNLYSYVGNNPINQTDPDGEVIPIIPAVILIGGTAVLEVATMATVGIMMEPGTEKTLRSPVCTLSTLMSASMNGLSSGTHGDQPMQMQLQITKDAGGEANAKYIWVPINPPGA